MFQFAFPAVFRQTHNLVSVSFPDLPGCFSCGLEEQNAQDNAADALRSHLSSMILDGFHIPKPSLPEKILLKAGERVVFIEAQPSFT